MTANTPSNLRVPGPTPLPPEVLDAVSGQMINHRGKSYEEIQKRVIENLQYFFQTENDIFLLTSSGMGGLEAAIVNFFSPGELIVSFTIGEFGNRWAEVARRFGAKVVQIKFTSGTAVTKEEVNRVLGSQRGVKGVLFTHNETVTGVLNKISDFAPIVKSHPDKPLLLIDSISALGAVDLPMDTLGIDVLVSASQKAWMAPPGLVMIAVSQKAWEQHKTSSMPRYYFDLTMYKEFALKNQTPATPAVATLFGLDASLKLMKKEGRENIYRRHLQLRDDLRSGIRKIGLELFVSESDASPTVTSIIIPHGVDGHEWLKELREKYHTVLAGGMGDTKGKIIRVAHMGFVGKKDLDEVLVALEKSRQDL
ncbi:hypothetical protein A3D03_00580 [Candidatus Gottesmanbacteria bacterium RIFCSPHIGHO2_02_FULL_40_13]|uniref:Aminotransferase class V domain-containing protein n=1 Tax=Candidatus Gottesmanbacteria bacterium RIFCSPHIGHO2_02_FULL_40_13 TaxID=1798384 RepID=A0A1F6A9E1_9BACT|nr:MAG: hypothetical protein A3D03_00580 [Candidatus Gottesmanbacteria bacterium RIFCSPHIGHO2_02_FULL_40_13]